MFFTFNTGTLNAGFYSSISSVSVKEVIFGCWVLSVSASIEGSFSAAFDVFFYFDFDFDFGFSSIFVLNYTFA